MLPGSWWPVFTVEPAQFGSKRTLLIEGFGLPPLEAMACGTPVVCSNASSLPEVVGEAGRLLPPTDVGAWVAALDRLLADPGQRADLGARGLARARQFTWAAAAQATLDVYHTAGWSA